MIVYIVFYADEDSKECIFGVYQNQKEAKEESERIGGWYQGHTVE